MFFFFFINKNRTEFVIIIVGEDFVPTLASMCSSGTLMVAPRAYKPWVGRISCRRETKVSSPKSENPDLPRHLKNKTLRAWLPKEDNKLAGVGTKASPTKRRFWGTVPISNYCLLWGFLIFSAFGLDTRTVLLPLRRARHASTTTTRVVVVHSW